MSKLSKKILLVGVLSMILSTFYSCHMFNDDDTKTNGFKYINDIKCSSNTKLIDLKIIEIEGCKYYQYLSDGTYHAMPCIGDSISIK